MQGEQPGKTRHPPPPPPGWVNKSQQDIKHPFLGYWISGWVGASQLVFLVGPEEDLVRTAGEIP